VEASNIGVKNLSPTQNQAIGCDNIPIDFHLTLGLCISWVVEKNFVKMKQLVNIMVKYVFCSGSMKYWSKQPVNHTNPSNWLCKHFH